MENLKIPWFNLLWPNEMTLKEWDSMPFPIGSFATDLSIEKILENFKTDDEQGWRIKDLFYKPCKDASVIKYRLDVLEIFVENPSLCNSFKNISGKINEIKEISTAKYDKFDEACKHAWLFEVSEKYVSLILMLKEVLEKYKNLSACSGFEKFLLIVNQIINSNEFKNMKIDVNMIQEEYKNTYNLNLAFNFSGRSINEIVVNPEFNFKDKESNKSYAYRIIEKSRQLCDEEFDEYSNICKSSSFTVLDGYVLKKMKITNSKLFKLLSSFYNDYNSYPVSHLFPYKYQIDFYTVMAELVWKMKKCGLEFCKPLIAQKGKNNIEVKGAYDLYLALQLMNENKEKNLSKLIVDNDYEFNKDGRIFILTGPNRGGKTTFIRSVGIIQILFQAGCYVPARYAAMSLVDAVYTHFPKEEVLGVNMGRLGEESERLYKIMEKATNESMILLNESFSSTRRVDGYNLGKDLIKALMTLGCMGIFVTHFSELAYEVDNLNKEIDKGSKLANLIAGVEDIENDQSAGIRTYKVFRAEGNGFGYTKDIVKKYGLTFQQINNLLIERGYLEEKDGEMI